MEEEKEKKEEEKSEKNRIIRREGEEARGIEDEKPIFSIKENGKTQSTVLGPRLYMFLIVVNHIDK